MQHHVQLSGNIISSSQTLVNSAIQYIYQNIRNNISVYDISEYLQISRQYVHRTFKGQTGTTINTFISHKKIKYVITGIILGIEDTDSAYLEYNFKDKHAFINQIQHLYPYHSCLIQPTGSRST